MFDGARKHLGDEGSEGPLASTEREIFGEHRRSGSAYNSAYTCCGSLQIQLTSRPFRHATPRMYHFAEDFVKTTVSVASA
jgi:hypothetical protein